MFQFEENEIGYTLTEYTAKDDAAVTSVKIPSVYQGEPVTCIGDCAFLYAVYLTSVIIPDSVTGAKNCALSTFPAA